MEILAFKDKSGKVFEGVEEKSRYYKNTHPSLKIIPCIAPRKYPYPFAHKCKFVR